MNDVFVDLQSPIPVYEFRQVVDAVDGSGRSIKMGITADHEKHPIYSDWIADKLPALHGTLGFDHSYMSVPVRVRTNSGAVFIARLFADNILNHWYREEKRNQILWMHEVTGWLPIDAVVLE